MDIGTAHFVSFHKACKYYKRWEGLTPENVQDKIAGGEIKIGKPNLKRGDKLILMDQGTRYGIETEKL